MSSIETLSKDMTENRRTNYQNNIISGANNMSKITKENLINPPKNIVLFLSGH